MLQSFGLSWDDIKVPDYFESISYVYARVERTFLVRKTKEFLVFVVKFLCSKIFFLESKRGILGSSDVLKHVNLSDIFLRISVTYRIVFGMSPTRKHVVIGI